MLAITTFSPKGYNLYGEKLLESLEAHWPGRVIAYVDEIPGARQFMNVEYKLLSDVFGHDQFISYCRQNPIFTGKIGSTYSYTFDAVKFCHKVFAQLDAFKNHHGKIYWIDGDSVLKKPVTEEFMSSIFNGATLAIMSRPGFYTETGFIGFDTNGEKFDAFVDAYTDMYRKGRVFILDGWHDCYALDAAINISKVPYTDLVGGWKMGDKLEVIEKTILGEYFVHNKGGKKFSGSLDGRGSVSDPVSVPNT